MAALVEIVSLAEVAPEEQPSRLAEAAAIFYETANTKTFDTPSAKEAYYRRWFGCYADSAPEALFLALDGGAVVGYLAACFDTFSDAARLIADDIPYYTPSFRAALSAYPAHFHINVKPGQQGKGVGRRLVSRLLEACQTAGSTGVHVVTGAGSRAVEFYEACRFRRVTLSEADGRLAILVYGMVAPHGRDDLARQGARH
jgi:GNAT superfamily N-acetyltransferase